MRRFVLSVAALCAVSLVSIGPELARADDKKSDETYTIQVAKFVPKGKSVRCTDKADVSSRVKVSDDQGTALTDKKTVKTSLRVYVEKTLAVNEKDGKRAKYTRAYETAKDIENDESESKPY